jgi:hypothetical protein
MMHIVNNLLTTKCYIQIQKKWMIQLISKSKPLCLTNIWTNDIDNEVNDPRPTIPIINTILIKHYDL